MISLKKRRALGGIISTLIILVGSVILGTGVVTHTTNLFVTTLQMASLSVQGPMMWVNQTNANNIAWGAVGIKNTGDATNFF